jgi:hypothetical protein
MKGENRTVVFIGSCAYSGSTVLDLMIGASENSRSLGEVGRAYLPQQKHHITRECGCLDSDCRSWDGVFEQGPKDVHQRIFGRSDATTLVDSTKDPHWIASRSKELVMQGIGVKNILLWKTPNNVQKSYEKRGLGRHWKRHWINYHRLYFSLVEQFAVIPFSAIVGPDGELEDRLARVELEVNREFWKGNSCSLFGNDSAKRHLHDSDSKGHVTLQGRRGQEIISGEKAVSRGIESHDSASQTGRLDQFSGHLGDISRFLEVNDVIQREPAISSYPLEGSLRLNSFSCSIRRIHQTMKSIGPRIKWGLS